MSERTFNKFKGELNALFYDYTQDYDEFTKKVLHYLKKHRSTGE